MWTLVMIQDDEENFPDIIPNSWLINEFSAWYPSNFRLSTIKSLAKTKALPVVAEWDTCKITEIIESNINDYEKGLRSMYKVSKKGVTVNFNSENEAKGRGLRHKFLKRRLEDDQTDNNEDESNDEILASTSEMKKTAANTETKIHNKNKTENHNLPSYPASPFPDFKKASQASEHLFASIVDKNSSEVPKCKLSKKKIHNCAFVNYSNADNLAQQLCALSGDIQKVKSGIAFIKQELGALVDENKSRGNLQQIVATDNYENKHDLGSSFPLKTENDLNDVEGKLCVNDKDYINKLISSFSFAAEGKTVNKITNNILKNVFADDLAALYSWKGQKTKKKLMDLRICAIIIDVVRDKVTDKQTCNKTDIITCIMTWFAQAPTRIQRNASRQQLLSMQAAADELNEAI